MGITAEGLRRIKEKAKTFDQAILDPNIFIKDFPLDPWSAYPKTNNFIQQGITRALGYSPDEEKWVRLRVDSDGRLYTTSEVTALQNVNLYARRYKDVVIADSVPVAAGELLVHSGVDINDYSKVTTLVASTKACVIYPQVSNDNVNFYDVKAADDTTRTFACNNEKIAFQLEVHGHYYRVVITTAVANTIDLAVSCQA